MNKGKYIFTQVMSLVPRQIFLRLVDKYKGDYRVRDFTCSNQLRYMMFGQLTSCESLRDICLCLNAFKDLLYGLGITTAVNESTLSMANENRDYHIYEGLGLALIKQVQPLYSKVRLEYLYQQDRDVFALDSTTISCSINLMSWAMGKYSKGAVKMHTLIDLRGSIPIFIDITDGRCHDSNILDKLNVVANAIYTMDKAYADFEALSRIDEEGGFFVTRAKDNMKYEVITSNFNIDEQSGLRGDHSIRLTGYKSSKLYPKKLRLVEYSDINTSVKIYHTKKLNNGSRVTGSAI